MAFTQAAVRAMKTGRRAARVQRRAEPGHRRRRVAGRPPAPARRAALGRGRELHRRRRPDQGHPAAALGDPRRCSPRRGPARAEGRRAAGLAWSTGWLPPAARPTGRESMLNVFARVHVDRVTEPIGRWLVGRGVAPDVGDGRSARSARSPPPSWFLPRGELFVGAVGDHRLRAVRPRRRGDGPGPRPRPRRSARCSTPPATGSSTAPCSPRWPGGASGVGEQPALGVAALICLVAGPARLLHQGPGRGRRG